MPKIEIFFHADKHGFLAIPPGEEVGLLEASVFMDRNECNTVIKAARSSSGLSQDEIKAQINNAIKVFGDAARGKFSKSGEFGS